MIKHLTQTLPQLLQDMAKRHPDRLAMRCKRRGIWQKITWRDYFDNVRLFALGLTRLGFQPGSRLLIAAENSPEWLAADLAAQALGGISVALRPDGSCEDMALALRQSGAEFALCGDQEQLDKLIQAMSAGAAPVRHIVQISMRGLHSYRRSDLIPFAEVIALGRQSAPEESARFLKRLEEGRSDALAAVVYTSGRHGTAKGALLSQHNLVAAAAALIEALGTLTPQSSYLSYLPLASAFERGIAQAAHLQRGFVVHFGESPETVLENLREIAPDFFLGMPHVWEKLRQDVLARGSHATGLKRWVMHRSLQAGTRLLHAGRSANKTGVLRQTMASMLDLACFAPLRRRIGLQRAAICLCAGAPAADDMIDFFLAAGVPICRAYGLTEAGGVTHLQRNAAMPGVGTALSGVQHRCTPGGELLLRGESLCAGYLGEPGANVHVMHPGWFATGDQAEITQSQALRILGRQAGGLAADSKDFLPDDLPPATSTRVGAA